MKKDKFLIIGIAALVVALGFWAARYFYKTNETKKVATQTTDVFVRPHSPRTGNLNSPVVVVEFFDPECESCRAVSVPVKELIKEFDAQLVLRYAPFHHNSLFAIKILEAARKQNKYWETLTVLFDSQPEWASHHNPQPEVIWEHLPKAGVDVEKIRAEMNDPATFDLVELDKEDGRKLNVTGTPTFFVNGRPLEGFGLDYLRDAIQRESEQKKN